MSTNRKGIRSCFFHTSKLFERTWVLRDIEQRSSRSLSNLFHIFSYKLDCCSCFMNDGEKPISVFEQIGNSRDIFHEAYYYQLLKEITQ